MRKTWRSTCFSWWTKFAGSIRDSVISVCAAGRAGLYMTTLATMAGLHIRVGIEDTPWKHPNSNTLLKDNLEMFKMARDLAGLLGRTPASANDYRKLIGKPELSTSVRPKVAQLASA